jgi:tRNA(His) guanylyltransferase
MRAGRKTDMAHSEFDREMKALEWYKDETIPNGVWPILRIDGRGFTKVTSKLNYEKPYDRRFHEIMSATTQALVKNLQALFGYHQSDEISILLGPKSNLFDRRVEKLTSVSASLAGVAFNHALLKSLLSVGDRVTIELNEVSEIAPHFDARLICAINPDEVQSYFTWRQQDAARNALNSWCHWTAIQKDGKGATAAGKLFLGRTIEFKNEFLFQHGINFNDLPLWQRRGTGIYWKQGLKEGFNPKTQQKVEVSRWSLNIDDELPMGKAYKDYVIDKGIAPGINGRVKTIITSEGVQQA